MEISIVLVGTIVAVLSSLIAEFWPGWNEFSHRRIVMLLLNLLVPPAIWVLVCLADVPLPVLVACDRDGLFATIGVGVMAVLENQGIYHLASRPYLAQRHG